MLKFSKMNKTVVFALVVFSLVLSGCFSSVPVKSSSSASSSRATGTVIKEAEFKKGGTLVILPFKAGVGAVANPQLDRVALMIVKGMIDYLAEQKTPFTVLSTEDQGRPQLVIEGYVNDFSQSGKMSRMIHGKKTTLSVSGQMVVSGTHDRLFVFQHRRSMTDPKRDGLDVAYQTGQDLGRFIVDALQ